MVKCDYCGKEVVLPYRCKYCGGVFCVEHHLPENHNCPGLKRGVPLEKPMYLPSRYSLRYEEYKPPPRPVVRVKRGGWFRFYPNELRDLIIATIVVFIAFAAYRPLIPSLIAVIFLAAVTTFVVHELAHKAMAQRYGYYARFTLEKYGLLLTLVTSLIPLFFRIIIPGDVRIWSPTGFRRDEVGKIAVAGPLSNIAVAAASMLLFKMGLWFFYPIAEINAWIAFFNMLPFGVLDGLKVIRWSIPVWAAVFAASAAMLVLTSYHFLL